MDRANEKGWRKDFHEYLLKRQRLETDAEQHRWLLEIPEVVAEDNSIGGEGSSCSVNSTLRELPEISSRDASGELDREDQPIMETKPNQNKLSLPFGSVGYMDKVPFSSMLVHQPVPQLEKNLIKSAKSLGGPDSRGVSEKQVTVPPVFPVIEVIELSDDEEEPENGFQNLEEKYGLQLEMEEPDNEAPNVNLGTEDAIWFYADPQNQTQGPFTIQSLQNWSDRGYFHSQFKVWRAGQNQEQAIFLEDVISHLFLQRGHPSS